MDCTSAWPSSSCPSPCASWPGASGSLRDSTTAPTIRFVWWLSYSLLRYDLYTINNNNSMIYLIITRIIKVIIPPYLIIWILFQPYNYQNLTTNQQEPRFLGRCGVHFHQFAQPDFPIARSGHFESNFELTRLYEVISFPQFGNVSKSITVHDYKRVRGWDGNIKRVGTSGLEAFEGWRHSNHIRY